MLELLNTIWVNKKNQRIIQKIGIQLIFNSVLTVFTFIDMKQKHKFKKKDYNLFPEQTLIFSNTSMLHFIE